MHDPPPTPEQWARLQSIRESGDFCCILLASDGAEVWDIFAKREEQHDDRIWLSGPLSCWTLGEAIDVAHANWTSGDFGKR